MPQLKTKIKMINQFVAVIPAAGIGNRFKDQTPKQYIEVKGKSVIERSIEHILSHPSCLELVVCLSMDDTWFNDLAISQNPKIKTTLGGKTRGESVYNGVKFFEDKDIEFTHFLIQDAVRPCLEGKDLDKLLELSGTEYDGTILGFPVSDTLKKMDCKTNQIIETVDRDNLWHSQTPQLFKKEALIRSLNQATSGHEFTDEAQLLESIGANLLLVKGSLHNIKLTYQDDLKIIKLIINSGI